ncbi:MAG: hypothetical protein D6730_22335 [Bacteroidetes bacterium]|nr:MAG: hypothetical protein D6730_22335 [Bacteroidota bacterium]
MPDFFEEKKSYEESIQWLREQLAVLPLEHIRCVPQKHKLLIHHNRSYAFRLPLPLPSLPDSAAGLPQYVAHIPTEIPPYILLLAQAGAAAMGYFEGGEVVEHKTIKKYMKRHKSGKAQITYLNQKGKSKAGSRIRLANTLRFFEEINQRMDTWCKCYQPRRILYSCGPQLWGLMFRSKVAPPFEKKDPRLLKIPLHVHTPNHQELLRINEQLCCGLLSPTEL